MKHYYEIVDGEFAIRTEFPGGMVKTWWSTDDADVIDVLTAEDGAEAARLMARVMDQFLGDLEDE